MFADAGGAQSDQTLGWIDGVDTIGAEVGDGFVGMFAAVHFMIFHGRNKYMWKKFIEFGCN